MLCFVTLVGADVAQSASTVTLMVPIAVLQEHQYSIKSLKLISEVYIMTHRLWMCILSVA